MEELKQRMLEWTNGLPVEGDTKEELKASLKARQWDLECEISMQARAFYSEIDNLDIPEE